MSKQFIPQDDEAREFLTGYMHGFWSHLKNPAEKAYCAARSAQLIVGTKRPTGMSAQFGVRKERVRNLEIVIRKVWLAGVAKVQDMERQREAEFQQAFQRVLDEMWDEMYPYTGVQVGHDWLGL